jgi:hypothetical protein
VRSLVQVPTVAVLAACVAALAGCSAVRPGRRPADTFEAAKRAILEENYVGLWRLIGERARDAEASKIRAQQREVEKQLGNLTPQDVEQFFRKNGVRPDVYVNLVPAEAFAAQVRNTARMAAGLREALLDSHVIGSAEEGDVATLAIEIPGEPTASLRLEREEGLWIVPSVNAFFVALRMSGRVRSPGKTPQETYDALIACVSARAYEAVWELLASEQQAEIAGRFRTAVEQVKKLDADQKRSFEIQAGMTADEYVTLAPGQMLAVELRLKFGDPQALDELLSRRADGVAISGSTAVLSLSGRGGRSNVHLKRQGDQWYLLGSDF